MKVSKAYTLLLFLICLMLLMFSAISFRVLEKDPPSVFNRGSGGLSTFASELMFSKGLKIIYSFSELDRINPEHYALLIVGPDQELYDIEYLIKWVNNGGMIITFDEFNHSLSFLKFFRIELGDLYNDIDVATCNLENTNISILVNVFRGIICIEGDTLCTYNGVPIAVTLKYGKGSIIVIGDSSLTINELSSKLPYWYNSNKQFILMLSRERRIAIYEGARVYSETASYLVANVLSILPNVVSDIALFFYEKPFLLRSLFVFILAFISMLFTMFKFGLPRKPVYRKAAEHEVDFHKHLKTKIDEGIEVWVKKIKEGEDRS